MSQLGFMKHVKLLRRYLVISIQDAWIAYRSTFFMLGVQWVVLTVIYLVFWQGILGYVTTVNGWTFPQLAVLACLVEVYSGLFLTFFAGAYFLPFDINMGQLDIYLVRPINPIFAAILQRMNPRGLIQVFVGLLLTAVVTIYFNLQFSFLSILAASTIMFVGVMLTTLIFAVSGCLSFWIERFTTPQSVLATIQAEVDPYPIDALGSGVQTALTFLIPQIFLVTIPAGIVVGRFGVEVILYYLSVGGLLTIIWVSLLILLWRKGLHRYESAEW